MVEGRRTARPFFSICIPQHNRTSFLIGVCESLAAQRFDGFEVCISDDCSTDGREEELLGWLRASPLSYVYQRRERNGRYDANLRSAIALAGGDYCFLLGNDDVLKTPEVLETLHAQMRGVEAAVVFTNFEDYRTGALSRRVRRTAVMGRGPAVAAGCFRKFSFVSGIVLHRTSAQAASATRWDGSEMYQMYIGCRLIATGGTLFESDLVTVRRDLQLAGESVDNYARRDRVTIQGIPEQRIPLVQVARLVIAAIEPSLGTRRFRPLMAVLLQYFGFLYPFWLLEYRRVQSWRFAAGIARAMRPGRTLAGVALSSRERVVAQLAYGAATLVGFGLPVALMDRLHRPARRVARWVGDRALVAEGQS